MMGGARLAAAVAVTVWLLPIGAAAKPLQDKGGPAMVEIPAGSFDMGADAVEAMRGGEMRSSGPVRRITFARPFAIGRTEVTNREFAAFVANSGYRPASACAGSEPPGAPVATDWRSPGFAHPPRPDEPVVCVSWHDAKAYVAWLARRTGKPYRLPSEAEWEYVARGARTTVWPWGEGEGDACRYANIARSEGGCDDGFAGMSAVGALQANDFGVQDMIGNVWEWVEDCSIIPYPAAPVDGRPVESAGPCEKRAVRGGSWRTRLSRQKRSFRGRDAADLQSQIFGFRVARDL